MFIKFRIANTVQLSVVQKRAFLGENAHNVDEPSQLTVGEVDVTNDVVFNTISGQSRIQIGHVDAGLTEELGSYSFRIHSYQVGLRIMKIRKLWFYNIILGENAKTQKTGCTDWFFAEHENEWKITLITKTGLLTNKFHGTLGELTVDGTPVPLWVFDASSGNCEGAAGPPGPLAVGHLFRAGFAQIRMPMTDRLNTMLTVHFSAVIIFAH